MKEGEQMLGCRVYIKDVESYGVIEQVSRHRGASWKYQVEYWWQGLLQQVWLSCDRFEEVR